MDETKINTNKETTEGKGVYIVDNGIVKLKASSEFSDGLFFIEYQGEEWLDSTFPKPQQRSWWNPWVGGIKLRPTRMLDGFMLKENISTDFIEIKDNFNNLWTSLKTTLKIYNRKLLLVATWV